MDERRLTVVIGSDAVADLVSDGHRRLELRYRDPWRAAPGSTPLSVSMPAGPAPYGHATVEPYLWGLFPDDERVVERWAREAGCSTTDVFGLLEARGADVAGAARYLGPGDPIDAADGGHEPLDEAEVGEVLRRVVHERPAWTTSSEPGRWSLAGAQAKVALARDPTSGQWSIPAGATPTTHILKPAFAGFDDIDVDEHLCLATARLVELPAARTTVETFGGQRTLVVERYDRRLGPDGAFVRIHQEDLCQALGVHPSQKYESDGGPTSRTMARLLWSAVGDAPLAQVEALCRSIAYDWLVLAPDTHAKNHSLLLSGRQVRLAPMYDVASILPYDAHPGKVKLAQRVGGEYRVTVIEGRHWERLARDTRVEPGWMRDTVLDLAERLPDAMADAIARSALTDDEIAFAQRLHEALVEWTGHCRRQVG
ncbi:MAG TPA: type II toxin-antitoxin system HipA family toxin [Iamia sp.]|nr:type II toxin-antitoxin system HipA family toxin [Iamia sp.]